MNEVNKVAVTSIFFFGDGAWSFGSFAVDFSEFHATGI